MVVSLLHELVISGSLALLPCGICLSADGENVPLVPIVRWHFTTPWCSKGVKHAQNKMQMSSACKEETLTFLKRWQQQQQQPVLIWRYNLKNFNNFETTGHCVMQVRSVGTSGRWWGSDESEMFSWQNKCTKVLYSAFFHCRLVDIFVQNRLPWSKTLGAFSSFPCGTSRPCSSRLQWGKKIE